jgi:hypothetical protein
VLLTSDSWAESDRSRRRLSAPFSAWGLVAVTTETAAFFVHTNQRSVDGQHLRSYIASSAQVLAALLERQDASDWDVHMWWCGTIERVTEFWVYRSPAMCDEPVYGYVGVLDLQPIPPWKHLECASAEATLITRFRKDFR